jgi:hypothetical protein
MECRDVVEQSERWIVCWSRKLHAEKDKMLFLGCGKVEMQPLRIRS